MPHSAQKSIPVEPQVAAYQNPDHLRMVDNQLRTAGVFDSTVIDAFLYVDRRPFVPASAQALAYSDATIPLDGKRFLMSPLVLGKILQALGDVAGKTVLIFGAATGYSAALLTNMGAQVVAVQSNAELAHCARGALAQVGCAEIPVVECGMKSAETQKLFDIILIEGSVSAVPDTILAKLQTSGQLLTIIGNGNMGSVTRFLKTDDAVSKNPLFEAAAPVLPGFEQPVQFTF